MKKTLSIMTIAALTFAANAQEHRHTERTDSLEEGTTRVYNNFVSRTDGIWNLNFLSISTDASRNCWQDNYWVDGPVTRVYADLGPQDIWLSYSGLADTKGFEQQVAHSLEFGFNLARIQHWNTSRTVGLQMSLGLSWNRYQTADKGVFQIDNNGDMFIGPWTTPRGDQNYSRSRLTYVSWRVPVMLQFQDRNQRNCFSVGVEGELRHHLRSRVRYAGHKRYDVERHNIPVNPWGLNAIAMYSIGDFGIFGRCALTDFFKDNKIGFDATPFTIGIIFHLDD